jgi:Cu+-exporting ATPase
MHPEWCVTSPGACPIVMQLGGLGKIIAMAGDDTNGAPALAAAHVGSRMRTGTDVAIQSVSVTVLDGDLNGVVRARRFSQRVTWNIRQNLFLASINHGLGAPIAAGVAYPIAGLLSSSMLASADMALSSFSVSAKALRLRRSRL